MCPQTNCYNTQQEHKSIEAHTNLFAHANTHAHAHTTDTGTATDTHKSTYTYAYLHKGKEHTPQARPETQERGKQKGTPTS